MLKSEIATQKIFLQIFFTCLPAGRLAMTDNITVYIQIHLTKWIFCGIIFLSRFFFCFIFVGNNADVDKGEEVMSTKKDGEKKRGRKRNPYPAVGCDQDPYRLSPEELKKAMEANKNGTFFTSNGSVGHS